MKNLHPNTDSLDFSLPEWQKEIIDKRLLSISEDPKRIVPISELFNEFDSLLIDNIKTKKN